MQSVDHISQSIDGVIVRMKDAHDFRFLHELGKVFTVFDEQDSGNISFGIDTGKERLFVKYAGAKPIDYSGKPEDAVVRLRDSFPVYEALRHSGLITLREHFAVSEGYVGVFEWFPGECLHAHWAFTSAEKYIHPDSPSYRHKLLSIEQRLSTLRTIFEFHQHVIRQNFVAIDFYDGSILYDFALHVTKICDIDCYRRQPYTNTMGRLWGSTRFMSPEEFEYSATIDEISNVYTMGATAFALLGGELDRTYTKWQTRVEFFEVARKATAADRDQRYLSFDTFLQAWNDAEEEWRRHSNPSHR